jgi:hypothetical protein
LIRKWAAGTRPSSNVVIQLSDVKREAAKSGLFRAFR